MAANNANNNNGNRIPSYLQRGDRSTLTNEMIRDQHIQSATNELVQSHQQFVANRQEMETMRIAQQHTNIALLFFIKKRFFCKSRSFFQITPGYAIQPLVINI